MRKQEPGVRSQESVSIAAFIRRNWPHCRMWERANLIAWVEWFMDRGLCAAIADGRKILAVGLARPVQEPLEGFRDHYAFTRGGDGVWVDLMVTRCAAATRAMWSRFVLLFGSEKMPRWIAFERGGATVRVYDFERFDRRWSETLNTQLSTLN